MRSDFDFRGWLLAQHRRVGHARWDRPWDRVVDLAVDVERDLAKPDFPRLDQWVDHIGRDSRAYDTLIVAWREFRSVMKLPNSWRYFMYGRYKNARSAISPTVRIRIFRRDGYRCRSCGHAPDDGVKLVIDHVVPVASGGDARDANLQTLCTDCNAGKSDTEPHAHDRRYLT